MSDNLFKSGIVRTADGQLIECGEWDDRRGYSFRTLGARSDSTSYIHLVPDTPGEFFTEVEKGLAGEEFGNGAGFLRVAERTDSKAVIDAFVENPKINGVFKFPVRKAA